MLPGGIGVAGIVLLAVLLLGVAVGRAKRRRVTLLLAGLIAVIAVGVIVTSVSGTGPTGDRAADIARLYTITVPLAVAFVTGWLCGRGSWFRRLIVIAVAALLLATFPYAAAGAATAQMLATP